MPDAEPPSTASPDARPPEPPRSRFQFGLGSLFLVTAMISVLAASFAGMLRAHRGQLSVHPGVFRLMAIASPLAVLIVVSLWYAAVKWLKSRP